jgi:hypothetical protein
MTRRRNGISSDLARAEARFDQWRRSASSTGRIPDSLWNLAVDLAREHGLSQTATTLKLGYCDLKKRVAERMSLAKLGPRGRPAAAFVELDPGPLTTLCECTIEFEKPCGSRLRIELKGNMLNIEEMVRSFWESA